jgi:hypothetical protein
MNRKTVLVNDQVKGEIYRSHSRWIWFRRNGSKEPFPRHFRLANIRLHIAARCLVPEAQVTLKNT